MFKKIAGRETKNVLARYMQSIMQAPIPVRIREYFAEENTATVQLIVNGETSDTISDVDQDTRFPIKGTCHETIARGIMPGETLALLYRAGWQSKKGYLELAHTPGTSNTPTYVPIRNSIFVGQ